MKVTNTIKQAIYNEIHNKAASKVNALQKAIKEEESKYETFCKKAKENVEEAVRKTLKDYAITHSKELAEYKLSTCAYCDTGRKLNTFDEFSEYLTGELLNARPVESVTILHSDKYHKLQQELDDLKKQVEVAINQIILDLELGESKQSVMDAIKKVSF